MSQAEKEQDICAPDMQTCRLPLLSYILYYMLCRQIYKKIITFALYKNRKMNNLTIKMLFIAVCVAISSCKNSGSERNGIVSEGEEIVFRHARLLSVTKRGEEIDIVMFYFSRKAIYKLVYLIIHVVVLSY